jgi:hypothetical protein
MGQVTKIEISSCEDPLEFARSQDLTDLFTEFEVGDTSIGIDETWILSLIF